MLCTYQVVSLPFSSVPKVDGSLLVGSDDDLSNSFSVMFLEKRIIVGVGLLIDSGIFRILLTNGAIQDYDSSRNLIIEQ
jgi:hypothetical protein